MVVTGHMRLLSTGSVAERVCCECKTHQVLKLSAEE